MACVCNRLGNLLVTGLIDQIIDARQFVAQSNTKTCFRRDVGRNGSDVKHR